jgi:hypothetical protein
MMNQVRLACLFGVDRDGLTLVDQLCAPYPFQVRLWHKFNTATNAKRNNNNNRTAAAPTPSSQ